MKNALILLFWWVLPSLLFAQEVSKGQWTLQVKTGGMLATHKLE